MKPLLWTKQSWKNDLCSPKTSTFLGLHAELYIWSKLTLSLHPNITFPEHTEKQGGSSINI